MRSIRSNEIIGNFEEKGGKFDENFKVESSSVISQVSARLLIRSMILERTPTKFRKISQQDRGVR